MSPEEAEAILNRQGTQDPTLIAVIEFVEAMCDAATREATGFHTASVINQAKDLAKARFITAMEKAAQSAQPLEG